MAEPTRISDDGEPELNEFSGYMPGHNPPPLDLNPGPSFAGMLTPSAPATSSAMVPIASSAIPEVSRPSSGPTFASGLDLINITDNPRQVTELIESFPTMKETNLRRLIYSEKYFRKGKNQLAAPFSYPKLGSPKLHHTNESEPSGPMAEKGIQGYENLGVIPEVDEYFGLGSVDLFEGFGIPGPSCLNFRCSLEPGHTATLKGHLSPKRSSEQAHDVPAPAEVISNHSLDGVPSEVQCLYQTAADIHEGNGSGNESAARGSEPGGSESTQREDRESKSKRRESRLREKEERRRARYKRRREREERRREREERQKEREEKHKKREERDERQREDRCIEDRSSMTKKPQPEDRSSMAKKPQPEDSPNMAKKPQPEDSPNMAKKPQPEDRPNMAKKPQPEDRSSMAKKPQPIQPRKVEIILNTIEANFPEATLQRIEEFVTPNFYLPRKILAHVIRQILLSPLVGNLVDETYRILSIIQEMHPATTSYVEWDWKLLTFVLEDQDRELPGQVSFLRYIFKTLEDDLQLNLKEPLDKLQNSIAFSTLSCDRHAQNIKDIIRWMVEILTGPTFALKNNFPMTDPPSNQGPVKLPKPFIKNQMVVLYLQKMLALAVVVDRSPPRTSSKIAEIVFEFVLHIPERNQREAFFTTMESHLLRSKILELILLHSSDKPTTLPMSFAKILFFLNNATLLYNQTEVSRWAKWDEFLQHLQFLLISYHHISAESQLVPKTVRKENATKSPFQNDAVDEITALDIEQQIEVFCHRMYRLVGDNMPFQLQEKLFLFKLLFLQAIHGKPLLNTRFKEGQLMNAHSLLGQEDPTFE